MVERVKKRNGSEVEFNLDKINAAIASAFDDLDLQYNSKRIMRDIKHRLKTMSETVSVEDIQDVVEEVLMKNKHFDVARHYIK